MSKTPKAPKTDIRIGTLVNAGMGSPDYIRQILPHGFESFSLTFWQTCEGVDFKKLAKEVHAVLDGTGAVISSLGIFGNPLESAGASTTLTCSTAISWPVSPGACAASALMRA